MKLKIYLPNCSRLLLAIAVFLITLASLQAEGSKDFWGYSGYRLFYNAEQNQQLKVFARAGEFINVGASHVGITGGFINVYSPNGTLAMTFNGDSGEGIIYNDVQELSGPTGGGTTNGSGYIPGVIPVTFESEGVWTIQLGFPETTTDVFDNILNGTPWTRAENQPLIMRSILAWDVTVTQGAAGNQLGNSVEGRVYSNEYASMLSGDNMTTSPTFYILSKDGYIYQIDLNETDPWGFPLFSNSFGVVNGDQQPSYASFEQGMYTRSADPFNWESGKNYLYDPQAKDVGSLINNKIFFNPPDPNMPAKAMVTDIFNGGSHTTWLYNSVSTETPVLTDIHFRGTVEDESVCDPSNSTVVGKGGFLFFSANINGTAAVKLDLDANGSFEDPIDRCLSAFVSIGKDSVFWDGIDGLGNVVSATPNLQLNYSIASKSGEVHIMMEDVENNPGGITFTRLNGIDSPSGEFYYDHSQVGSSVSGNGTPGNPQVTTTPFTYTNRFGNELLLDYWTFIEFPTPATGSFSIAIYDSCLELLGTDTLSTDTTITDTTITDTTITDTPIMAVLSTDSDGDGISNAIDLDDDNDGIPDRVEFCTATTGFACPDALLDPSADQDQDQIPNFSDANDVAFKNDCLDENADGICDQLNNAYDLDGDGVPNHLDLDSDNDGITDLWEAGHQQIDIDRNGIIDGEATAFGLNGLFNELATDADRLDAEINYFLSDKDKDRASDYKDLDSDNDGIHDVVEGNFGVMDSNDDGLLDDGMGNTPMVTISGLVVGIIPDTTAISIVLPPDTDGDGVFDLHDLDSDNDGLNDVIENIRVDLDNDGVVGSGLPIVNLFGVPIDTLVSLPAATSKLIDTDEDQIADFRDLDSDADGIFDVNEANQPDPDNNGVIGRGVPVINRNGQGVEDITGTTLTVISNPRDLDGDSRPDFQDIDRDADGILDSYECPGGWPCLDTDGDRLLDVDDLDSDNDLLPDSEECAEFPCSDDNNNQIDNFREYNCHNVNTPILTKVNNSSFCVGAPIDLVVLRSDLLTDPLSYTWTGPGDFLLTGVTETDSFTLTGIDTTGAYSLVLTTPQGCESNLLTTNLQVIESLDTPLLKISETAVCEGQEVTLSTAAFPSDAISYEWYVTTVDTTLLLATTKDSIFQISNIKEIDAGSYSVALTGSGCGMALSDPIALAVSPPVEEMELFAFAFSEDPVCSGSPVTLSVFEIGDSTVVYEWFGPQGIVATGASLEIDTSEVGLSGTYTARAKIGNCTIESNEIDLAVRQSPQDIPEVEVPSSLCAGTALNLKTAEVAGDSVVYEWYFNTGENQTLLATTTDPAFKMDSTNVDNSGEYSVIAIADGCPSPTSLPSSVAVQTLAIEASSSVVTGTACEGASIELKVTTIEGASYEWFGPAGSFSTEVAPNFAAATEENNGAYYAVATLDGCTIQSNEVNLAINPIPTKPQLVSNKEGLCNQENIELSIGNVEEGVSYEWYVLQNDTLSLLATTTAANYTIENTSEDNTGYYLVIAKNSDCFSEPSEAQLVTIQPSLELTPTSSGESLTPACSGDPIIFSLPEIPGATYEWYGPNGLFSKEREPEIAVAQPAMSGQYYAIVTAGPCTETTPVVNVLVNGIPGVPELSVSQNDFCSGETIQLNATITDGRDINYNWYFDNGVEQQLIASTEEPTFFIDRADIPNNGQYAVEVAVDGCVSSSSNVQQISVEEALGNLKASANATLSSPACSGERVILSATDVDDATYEWYGPSGDIISRKRGFTIPNADKDISGKYYAKVTLGGCTKFTNEVDVLVKEQPGVPQLEARENSLCFGEILELATTAYTGVSIRYNWYFTSEGGQEILVTTTPTPNFSFSDVTEGIAGTYSVEVVVDGCTSAKSNAQLIAIQPSLGGVSAFSTIVSDKPVCEGETVSFFTTPVEDATYKWYGPNGFFSDQANPSLISTALEQSGQYYAIVAFDGCSTVTNEISLTVKSKPEKPQLFVEDIACTGGVLELNATTYEADELSYDWIYSDGKVEELIASTPVSTFPISNISPEESGFYSVSIQVDGCTSAPSNFEKVEVQPSLPSMAISSSATEENPACEGDRIDLSAPFLAGARYEWFGPNNFSSAVINPSIPISSSNDAGAYFAVVTLNGCPNQTEETMVAIREKPETPFLVAEEAEVCVGEIAILKATSSPDVQTDRALFYQWYYQSTNQIVGETLEGALEIPDANLEHAGDYFVALNNDGCNSELSNSVSLEVDEMPEETAFILDESSNFCAATEIDVEAVQPTIGRGQWSVPNSNAAIIDATNNSTIIRNLDKGGNTILWSLSYKGCDNYSTDTIFAFRDGSAIRAENDEYTIQINNSLEETNLLENDLIDGLTEFEVTIKQRPAFGKLINEGGMIQYIPNPNYFGTDAFEYEICNTACEDMCDLAAVKINIVDENSDIQCFAPNVITPNGDGFNDGFRIPCVEELNFNSELKIFNRWGDQVYLSSAYKNDWTGTYNGKPLPAGTYFYLLRIGDDQTKCLQGYFQLLR